MESTRIVLIVCGIIFMVISVCNILHLNSSLFLIKRVHKTLSDSERLKYQKALAIPYAILGIIISLIGVFFFTERLISVIVFFACLFIYWIWIMVINKKYLGVLSPWSLSK